MTDKRRQAVEQWANQEARNPRYKGVTPNQVARAMLRKRPEKDTPRFKSRV